MTLEEIQGLIKLVSFQNYHLKVTEWNSRWYLQGKYLDWMVEDPSVKGMQRTRKWLLSPEMTRSEVIQTAFALCQRSMEHRTREYFTYRGRRIYGPHFDAEELWKLCGTDAALEERS